MITQLSNVFIILYGLTLFKEQPSVLKLAGAALIIGANVLIFYKPGRRKFEANKYSSMAILAALVFATAISIDIDISKNFNLPIYISLTLLIPALMIGLAGRIKAQESINELKRGKPVLFLITGISWALTIFFSLRAFQLGEVNTIITLQAASVLLNVLAAYIFLKERDRPLLKIGCAVLVILGVLLTTH